MYSVQPCQNIDFLFSTQYCPLMILKNSVDFGEVINLLLHVNLQSSSTARWRVCWYPVSFDWWNMRHQINFRQYNPNKPAKYGLLYKSLNDARFRFTYQVVAYCEKLVEGTGPYYFSVTEDYVKHLVQSVPVSSMKGRNISMEQLYTSILTLNWLLKHNITSV